MILIPDIFCCPYCHGDLIFDNGHFCSNCNLSFPYNNDIHYFFNPQARHWQKVMNIERHLLSTSNPPIDMDRMEKVYGIYQEYEGEPYKTARELQIIDAIANSALLNYSFDIMRNHLYKDDSYMMVVGARAFWDSYFFARYKKVIALDVVDDIRYINTEYGKGIIRVVADGMYLPIKSDSVSLIYMNATFHHMEDKQKALDSWWRALKPYGMVVASGEYYCLPEEKGSLDYMGEYSYMQDDFNSLITASQFSAGALFPISYCENMQYKMGIELTGKPDNGIIVLIK